MKYQIDDEVALKGLIVGMEKRNSVIDGDYIVYGVKINSNEVQCTEKIVYLTEGQINGKVDNEILS